MSECRNGHDLTKPDATYTSKHDGSRRCAVCRQIRRSREADKRKRKRASLRKRKATIAAKEQAAAVAARAADTVWNQQGYVVPPAGIQSLRVPGRRFTTAEDQARYRLALLHRQPPTP